MDRMVGHIRARSLQVSDFRGPPNTQISCEAPLYPGLVRCIWLFYGSASCLSRARSRLTASTIPQSAAEPAAIAPRP